MLLLWQARAHEERLQKDEKQKGKRATDGIKGDLPSEQVPLISASPATTQVSCLEVHCCNSFKPTSILVNVGSTKVDAVIDSGSGSTIMSWKLFNNLFANFPLSGHVNLKAASGHMLPVLGSVDLQLTLFGRTVIGAVHIVDNFQWDLLVGTDFLVKMKAKIDYDKCILNVNKQKIHLSICKYAYNAIVADDTVVPSL